MFQRYVENINPEDEDFLNFVSGYLEQIGVKDPKSLAYGELYKLIKEAIREYLRLMESKSRSKK